MCFIFSPFGWEESRGKLNLFFSFSSFFVSTIFYSFVECSFFILVFFVAAQIELCFNKNSRRKTSSQLFFFLFHINLDTTSEHKNVSKSPFYVSFFRGLLRRHCSSLLSRKKETKTEKNENKHYLKQQIVILNRFRNWKSYNKISSNHFRERTKWKKERITFVCDLGLTTYLKIVNR